MMFLAQAPSPTDVTSLRDSLNDGALATMLALVVLGVAYILNRLFSKTDGIITKAGDRHNALVDQTIIANQANAQGIAGLVTAAEMERATGAEHTGMLKELIDRGEVTWEQLERLGESALDILTLVCGKLEIEDRAKGSIEAFRRDLRRFSTERRSNDDDDSIPAGNGGRAAGR